MSFCWSENNYFPVPAKTDCPIPLFQGILCPSLLGNVLQFMRNKPCYHIQVHPLFDKAESKNKLLRSVAGGGVEQIGQLQARWDKFEMMMESHELMVKEQVSNIDAQILILVDVILPFGTLVNSKKILSGRLGHMQLLRPRLEDSALLIELLPSNNCLNLQHFKG